jgi:hypothetical protein
VTVNGRASPEGNIMRIQKTRCVAVLLLSVVAGCGSANPDGTYKAIIAVKKQAASAFEEIKDDTSAESVLPKVDRFADRYVDLMQQMKGFNLSGDQSEKLIDTYWKQEGEAGDELTRAVTAAKKRAPRHAERMTAILKKMGILQTTIQSVKP